MPSLSRHALIVALALSLAGCAGTVDRATTAPSKPAPTAVPSVSVPTPSAPTAPATTAPSPSPASVVSAGEAWIAMQAESAAGYGVHFVRPDGTGLHRWTAEIPGTQEHPDWSPDGQRVLVNAVSAAGLEDIWIADADGTGAERVVDCVEPCRWADEPSWSPDGASIIFQRLVVGDAGEPISTLERLDVASGLIDVLLTMPPQHVILAPRYAPDGSRLTVEVVHLPTDSWVAEPDGGAIGIVDLRAAKPEVEYLTEFTSWANNPDWSPLDDVIVYCQFSDVSAETADLYAIEPDGTDGRQLTDVAAGGGRAYQPTITPDGSRVLFVLDDPAIGADGMASIAIDGTDLRPAAGDTYVGGTHPRLRPAP